MLASSFAEPADSARHAAGRAELFRWLPVLALPTASAVLTISAPGWVMAWSLALAFFFALKWVSLSRQDHLPVARTAAYVLLWPGMDADAFLQPSTTRRPIQRGELLQALCLLAVGAMLLVGTLRYLHQLPPLWSGWMGLLGLGLVLLFGIFHLLSIAWRRFGVLAEPIMERPWAATSVAAYWGNRWNRAFSDIASRFLFRPGVRRFGRAGMLAGVFLFSGLIHDVVISLPARGGWGRPTLYFLIQAAGVLLERSAVGRMLRLGRHLRGRLFWIVVTFLPLPLLVHPPFLHRVVVPMLAAARRAAGWDI